jgi:UDP-N-acetylglucosamine 1-carboxyvinyltransferase
LLHHRWAGYVGAARVLEVRVDTFVIEGGRSLQGSITVEGNKNAALPLLACTLLTSDTVVLDNVPRIRDVDTMQALLVGLGVEAIELGKNQRSFTAKHLTHTAPQPELCRQMRASFALAGPLLARMGSVTLPSPGGDRIGRRPLDTHVVALQQLGAHVEVDNDRYVMTVPGRLRGADVFLEEMSVMATENVVMAASLAEGTTVIRNAASEPHVQDVCHLLVAMGANIEGIGTNTLVIVGVERLHGATFAVGPDYLEVGSFIALAAMTKSALTIRKARPADHRITRIAFARLGVTWEDRGDDIFVPAEQSLEVRSGLHGAIARIHDAPWPGFPADLVSIALVMSTCCKGSVLIHEWMYESRLYWVDKLIAMGARITVCDPHRCIVEGPARLYGQTMASPDIRAGMALLLAALVAQGKSIIQNAQQIDRGYANIEHRLQALGAKIDRV